MNSVVGIDNGVTGGLVVLALFDGSVIASMPMPIKLFNKRKEIDPKPIIAFLDHYNMKAMVAILERPTNAKTKTTAASMAGSYHAIRIVLEVLGITHHRITPQSWQKKMIPDAEPGESKSAALKKAREIWPAETWLASSRSSKPHEGLIDAALIAEYGRRHL